MCFGKYVDKPLRGHGLVSVGFVCTALSAQREMPVG